jgi:hypothetical protein
MRRGFENKRREIKPPETQEDSWVPLAETKGETSYTAEYLSLLARRNKLTAKKINGVWHTTKPALDDYAKTQRRVRKELNKNLTPIFSRRSLLVASADEKKGGEVMLARSRMPAEPKTFTNLALHVGEINISEKISQPRKINILSSAVRAGVLTIIVGAGGFSGGAFLGGTLSGSMEALSFPEKTGQVGAALFGVMSGGVEFLTDLLN